ncbi:MAG TPA: alpha/beta hydrolase [Steroidobacteraceae bacterium]|jgi:pimeloyl-ACP methyl ester carboxylesterase|nr:alpha/beta hydrolase [Steroidobacteraceae bacterium]
MNFRILRAILKKDVLSLLPLASLTALLFLGDALITRLDLLPFWSEWGPAVLLVAFVVFIISVFQLDSPASLTEDWLCRPVRKRELIGAKLVLLLAAIYLPRAIGTCIADVSLGFSMPESFLDAVLLPNTVFLFILPLLMFAAIITRTFVQGFGVLFAIYVCAFGIPTPFVREPGPLDLGIRDALLTSGMAWVSTAPARLALLALAVLGFWLVYWRRSLTQARVLMGVTVYVTLFLLVLPMGFAPWKSTFAVQTAVGPTPPGDATRFSLRNTRVCFPAAFRAELSNDAGFMAARRGVSLWANDALRDVGPNAIAFLTAIEARGLPLEWRVKLNHVQADYSAGGKRLESLRPASFITDFASGGALNHAWMLPESTLQKLRGVQPQLQLTYSLTLLKPIEHSLPTDGRRHALPGLGWCSAEVDEPGNVIDVDCFSAISHPTQISAQLNEISASRVYGSVDFSPRWTQWPYGERVKLAIASPRLAKHQTVTVTAWEAAGFVSKSLTLPGILGDITETCPLPTKDGNLFQKARWRDGAPHEPSSLTVDEGVQLEVLDFGGKGSPILLLPGMGATAHSYDELAPLLAQKHRVVALTRRGSGASSKPDFGFDTPRLSQDVLRVMDAMGLQKVVLVGHSIAGDELTWLGGHHPERFDGLVYLDAAYDRSGERKNFRVRELGRFLPAEPPIPQAALQSFDAMTKLRLERGHLRLPEGELIAFFQMDNPYLAGTPSIDGRTMQASSAALEKPDYAKVKIPALAIYAIADSNAPLPARYDVNDKQMMADLAEKNRLLAAMQRENIELFRRTVEKGQVLELQNALHYIFQSNQQEVLEAIEKFAAEVVPRAL